MAAEQGPQRASAVIDRRYRGASFQLWAESFSTFRVSPPGGIRRPEHTSAKKAGRETCATKIRFLGVPQSNDSLGENQIYPPICLRLAAA